MNDGMHHIYGSSQPCLTLLVSCKRITYDNYIYIGTNETFINKFFTITLHCITIILYFYAMTQLFVTITKTTTIFVFIF
jgi:hypothetical protein